MTTSATTLLKSVVSLDDATFTPAQLGYIKGDATAAAHECILGVFLKAAAGDGVTKAFVARRLGKKPEQVTRWLSSPTNLTVGTYAEILAAMGHDPIFGARDMKTEPISNERHDLCGARYLAPRTVQSIQPEFAAKEVIKNVSPGMRGVSTATPPKISITKNTFSQQAVQLANLG